MSNLDLSICGIPINISAESRSLIDLFKGYFRYYNPVQSDGAESPGDSIARAGVILELNILGDLPPRTRLIPRTAELFSQTGVIGLWRENNSALRPSISEKLYFDMETAAYRVEAEAGRIVGLITPAALESPQVLTNTYTLFPLMLGMRSRGVYLLHAAALLSPTDELWLICGSQRTGKSTLTTALGLAGWRPLSDDSMLVSRDEIGVFITAFKKNFHLGIDLMDHWPQLRMAVRESYGSDRVSVGGLEFFGTEKLADERYYRVDRIVLTEITKKPVSRREEISGIMSLPKLAEQSAFFQLWSEHVERQWTALSSLTRETASYRFLLGADILSDPASAAATLESR